MKPNGYQARRIKLLHQMGNGYRTIASMVGVTQREVLSVINEGRPVDPDKHRRRQLAALRKARPRDRSVAEHERVIAGCFPELLV